MENFLEPWEPMLEVFFLQSASKKYFCKMDINAPEPIKNIAFDTVEISFKLNKTIPEAPVLEPVFTLMSALTGTTRMEANPALFEFSTIAMGGYRERYIKYLKDIKSGVPDLVETEENSKLVLPNKNLVVPGS
jgi:hypothetical protein